MFFDDYDDGSCCSHCGVYLEVIGPPGPQHKSNCPEAIEAARVAEAERKDNEEFIKKHKGLHPCGCLVTKNGIERPCFSRNCRLFKLNW